MYPKKKDKNNPSQTPAYQSAADYVGAQETEQQGAPIQRATLNDYPKEYSSYPAYLNAAEKKASSMAERTVHVGGTLLEFESKEAAKVAGKILPPVVGLYRRLSVIEGMLDKIKGGDEKKEKLQTAKEGMRTGLLTLQSGKKEAKKELRQIAKDKAKEKIDGKVKEFEENKDKASYGLELVKGCVDHVTGSTKQVYDVLDFVALNVNPDNKTLIKAMGQAKDQVKEFKESDLLTGMETFSGYLGVAISAIKILDPKTSDKDRMDEAMGLAKAMLEKGGAKGSAATAGFLYNMGKFYDYDNMTEDERADLLFSTGTGAVELATTLSELGVASMTQTAKAVGVETSAVASFTMGGRAAMFLSHWGGPITLAATITWESVKWVLGEVAKMNKAIYTYELGEDMKPIMESGNAVIGVSKEIAKLSALIQANKNNEMLVDGFGQLIAAQMVILKKHLMKILKKKVRSKGLRRELKFMQTFAGRVKSLSGFNSQKNIADLRFYAEATIGKLGTLVSKAKIEEMAGFDFRKDKQAERTKDASKQPFAKDQAMFEAYGTLDPKVAAERKEKLAQIDTYHSSYANELSKRESVVSSVETGSWLNDTEIEYSMLDKNKSYVEGSKEAEIIKKKGQLDYLRENPSAFSKYKENLDEFRSTYEDEKIRRMIYVATIRSKKQMALFPEKDQAFIQFLIDNPAEMEAIIKSLGPPPS